MSLSRLGPVFRTESLSFPNWAFCLGMHSSGWREVRKAPSPGTRQAVKQGNRTISTPYEWQRCRSVEAILLILLSGDGRGQSLVDLHSHLNLLNIPSCCCLPLCTKLSIAPHQPRMRPHLLSGTYIARIIMVIGYRLRQPYTRGVFVRFIALTPCRILHSNPSSELLSVWT